MPGCAKHYLNPWWFDINDFLWHSHKIKFTGGAQDSIASNQLKTTIAEWLHITQRYMNYISCYHMFGMGHRFRGLNMHGTWLWNTSQKRALHIVYLITSWLKCACPKYIVNCDVQLLNISRINVIVAIPTRDINSVRHIQVENFTRDLVISPRRHGIIGTIFKQNGHVSNQYVVTNLIVIQITWKCNCIIN